MLKIPAIQSHSADSTKVLGGTSLRSSSQVRDFCLHLFCQCNLKSAGDSDTNAHPCRIGGASFSVVWVRVTKGVQIVRKGCATY